MIKILKKLSHSQGLALTFLTCVTLLSGCATFGLKTPEPVTVGQVIQLSKDDVPPETIVKIMRDSGTVYRFTASQLAELHDLGVADQDLVYMQQTYIDAECWQQGWAECYRGCRWGRWGPGLW